MERLMIHEAVALLESELRITIRVEPAEIRPGHKMVRFIFQERRIRGMDNCCTNVRFDKDEPWIPRAAITQLVANLAG